MSARQIHSHKMSSSRMIKRSLMGSALAAGIASATLMGTQTAWAQGEAPAPQGAGAQNPIGGGSVSQGAATVNSQKSAKAAAKTAGPAQEIAPHTPQAKNPEKQEVPATKAKLASTGSGAKSHNNKSAQADTSASAYENAKLHANTNSSASDRSVAETPTPTPAHANGDTTDDDAIIEIKDGDLKRLVYLCVTKDRYYSWEKLNAWNLTQKDARKLEELATHGYGYGKTYTATSTNQLDSEEGIALIKKFTQLKRLNVGGCDIKHPEKLLAALPQTLESLELGTTSLPTAPGSGQVHLTDSSALARFTQLKHLSLSGITLNDMKFLGKMGDLEDLNLAHTGTHELSPLNTHTKLKTLNISENELSDISALSKLTNLTNLNISDNNIQSLDPLKNLRQLETLDASNNKIEKIDALQGLTKLKTLTLNHNKISSLEALKDHNALAQLDIESNCVKDVAPLASLVQKQTLTTIKGDCNNIRDISPIWDNLPAKVEDATDGLRQARDFSYTFYMQTLDFDYRDGVRLDDYGIKAGDSGIAYTQDNETVTSESLNTYTGSTRVSFDAKDNFYASQPGIHLLHISPISQTFTFSGEMRIYRYKLELNNLTPIPIDFGGKLPSIDEIKKRISIKNIEHFPKEGHYQLLAGTESAEGGERVTVYPFPGGSAQGATVSIVYYKPGENDPSKRAGILDNIDVPVYVRTMAESYHPDNITLQAGKTLDRQALEAACKKLIPFNRIEKSKAKEEGGYYPVVTDGSADIDVWYKESEDDSSSGPQDDINPKQVYCTEPVFNWGSFQSITASANDEGTTREIPVTITYADHSVWTGKITIDIPKPQDPHAHDNDHNDHPDGGGSGFPIPDDGGSDDHNGDHNNDHGDDHNGDHEGNHDGTHNPSEDPNHSHTDGTGDTTDGTSDGTDTNGAGHDDSSNDNTTTPHRRRGRHFARTHQAQGTSDIDAASTAASASAEGTNGTGSNGQDNAGTGTDAGKGVSGDANADANASSSADTKRSGTNSNDAKEASAHGFFDQLASWLSEHANFLALIIVLLAAAGAFATAKHKKRAQAAAKRKRSAQEDAREVTQTKTK